MNGSYRPEARQSGGPGARWIGPTPEDIGPWIGHAPEGPLELQGRVVVLHLFSAQEVATAHTTEGIERLSWRFHDRPLQFLGVFVGNARTSLDLLNETSEALARLLQPSVPLLLDPVGAIASRYAAQRLPALVVLDAQGAHVGSAYGDPDWRALETTLERLIVAEAMSGALLHSEVSGVTVSRAGEREASNRDLSDDGEPQSHVLSLVGEVCTRADGLTAVAETGANRVLIGTVEGDTLRVEHTVGTGAPAFFDGRVDEASLCRPRGLLFDTDDGLLIADTGNHALRRVDLGADPPRVTTLAGTGRCGSGEDRCAQELLPALTVDLRSPWSLSFDADGRVRVLMGDDTRPWRYELSRGRIYPLEDETTEPATDLLGPLRKPRSLQYARGAAAIAQLQRGPEVPVRPGAGLARAEPITETFRVPLKVSPLGTTVELCPVVQEGRWALGSVLTVSEPLELGADTELAQLNLRGQLEDPEYGSLHAVDVAIELPVTTHEAAPFVTQVRVTLSPGAQPQLEVIR